MTSMELIALMECNRKYRLQSMSLKGQNEKHLCFHMAVRMIAKGIAEHREKQDLLREVETYLRRSYREEWFYLDWQRENAVKMDMAYLARFLAAYRISPGQKVKADFPVEIDLSLECNEVMVDKVSGKADLLIQNEDGSVTGVILCRNFKKPYSYLARKEEHMVMSSVELLVLLEGLKRHFPVKRVQVQMIRMISPDDTPEMLAVFEPKKGKNIIQFTEEEYYANHPQGVMPQLRSLVQNAELAGCDDCIFQEMCQRTNIMHLKKQEEQPVVRKEVCFSEVQREVISHKDGPLRVCAGPGSGKTAVLVERVKHLIECGVPPQRILAITFTKKAAQEMEERIAIENGPLVCTLHALAFRLLTEQEYLIGTVRLASAVDCKYLLLKILNHAPLITGVSYEGITMRYGLISSLLKDFTFINSYGREKFAAAFPKKDIEGIMLVKQLYDNAFREMGYITYDEQITMAVEVLQKYSGILESVQDAYDYIMVDEVQDLDEDQATFVKLLVRPSENNLMICGDADQSIYEFRGGSNQFMLDFPNIYSETKDLWLQKNFRSSREIVELSNELIAQNEKRVPMEMQANYHTGYKPIHIPQFCTLRIPELVQEICQKGYTYGDIAIIARTNKELVSLCDILNRRAATSGIAIPVDKPKYFLCQDFVFQTVLDLLELKIKGMEQDKPLFRLLSAMGCNVVKNDRAKSIYEDHLHQGYICSFDGSEASRYYLPSDDSLVCAYARIYRALQKLQLPIRQALDELREELFSPSICTEEVFSKLRDMIYEKKVRSCLQMYESMMAMKLFEDDTRVYYKDADRNRVHMLTAHDAKGKEFPVVILCSVDEFEGGDPEEDRRTLYVAITRAKRVLFLLEGFPGKSSFLRDMSKYITINRRERYEK